jgi:hypothetical protein
MAPRKYLKEAAARARLARNAKAELQAAINTQSTDLNSLVVEILSSGSESGYYGGVNTILSSLDITEHEDDGWFGYESLLEFDDCDVAKMVMRGQENGLYNQLEMKSRQEWAKVEANRSLGYNGLSDRTQRRKANEARKRKQEREEARNS